MTEIDRKLHWVYLLVAAPLCLLFVFLQAPFRVIDEQRHYIAAGALAEGNLRCIDGRIQVSKTKVDLISKMGLLPTDLFPKPGFDWGLVFGYKESDGGGTVGVRGVACEVTSLFGHTFSAVGLQLSRVFGLNELQGFYVARVFNSAFGTLLAGFAIYIAPFLKLKRVFFVVGLLPTVLFHFSSITYDSLVVSGLLLFVATALRARVTMLNKHVMVILLIPGFFAVFLKPIYFPVAASFFLYLYGFSRNKLYLAVLGIVAVLVILVGVSGLLHSGLRVSRDNSFFRYTYFHESIKEHFVYNMGYEFDVSSKVRSLLVEPWLFVKALVFTVVFLGLFNLLEMYGYIGWERSFLGYLPAALYLLFVLVFLANGDERNEVYVEKKAGIVLGLLLSAAMIYVFMYVFMTPVGVELINGVQGKYFVPLLPPIFWVARGFVLKKLRLELTDSIAFLCYAVSNVFVVYKFMEWY